MPPASRTKKKTKAEASVTAQRQRIDRWLWHARIVKTRNLAASLVTSGHVRVNGKRVESSGHAVRKEDVLTVALPRTVRILRVMDYADRRGNAAAAVALYEEIKP
jgi:ribosome-associated heat shock protein Hsp15